MKNPTDVLKKYDYKIIKYAADLRCPCGDQLERANLVGWCETNIGHMMVFECPECFTKFRYHANDYWDDTLEDFNKAILRKLHIEHRRGCKIYFNNGEEIYNKIQ